jgi:multisubunit Na+/H+ antiporter MnhE subunit
MSSIAASRFRDPSQLLMAANVALFSFIVFIPWLAIALILAAYSVLKLKMNERNETETMISSTAGGGV